MLSTMHLPGLSWAPLPAHAFLGLASNFPLIGEEVAGPTIS